MKDTKDTDTIEEGKARIRAADGIGIVQQRLMKGRTQLEDDRTLSDYNIRKACTLQLCKPKLLKD